ncbi:MAG TPA: TPM domain-containing protein [Gemmatimonadaceae bacterium]|nr:TPM domain-containing protein [Gemmatimonadaceae bacterium]
MASTLLPLLAAVLAAAPQQSAPRNGERLLWVPNPTQTTHGWVSDPAHHLSPETTRRIDSTIFALERATSDEMAVVVIDSLDGLEPSEAALLLHRRWGVGTRDRNNGIVFLWSPALRKMYVSVGYRLEGILPDARVGRIEDEVILPQFSAGNFDAGVLSGVAALAAAATADSAAVNHAAVPAYHPPEAEPAAPVRSASGEHRRSPVDWGGFLGLAALLGVGLGAWQRFRPRRCPNGHGRMMRLDEAADDAKLSEAQRLEEQLHSVNYDVWACRKCAETIVVPHAAWLSSYHRCARCGRRTSRTRSETLIAATTENEGMVKVTTHCHNCGLNEVSRRTIPRLPAPTATVGDSSGYSSGGSFGGSSGGGGGGDSSSFGGGSAGGGGAGRSY